MGCCGGKPVPPPAEDPAAQEVRPVTSEKPGSDHNGNNEGRNLNRHMDAHDPIGTDTGANNGTDSPRFSSRFMMDKMGKSGHGANYDQMRKELKKRTKKLENLQTNCEEIQRNSKKFHSLAESILEKSTGSEKKK